MSDSLGALAMEALHRQVLPFLLRRMKEDVLQDLPPKIIQDYHCDLSPLQVRILLTHYWNCYCLTNWKSEIASFLDSSNQKL